MTTPDTRRVMVHAEQDVTREAHVTDVWGNGNPPDNDDQVKSDLERFFDAYAGSFSSLKLTRADNGNILLRPNAVYGI